MSDYNQLGTAQYASQQFANQYGFQDFGGFWGSILGSIGGRGVANTYGPDSDGWYDYVGNPAPKDKLCQFKQDREENEGYPWVGYSSEFRPEMNVAYLKWRLTGIAKEAQDG